MAVSLDKYHCCIKPLSDTFESGNLLPGTYYKYITVSQAKCVSGGQYIMIDRLWLITHPTANLIKAAMHTKRGRLFGRHSRKLTWNPGPHPLPFSLVADWQPRSGPIRWRSPHEVALCSSTLICHSTLKPFVKIHSLIAILVYGFAGNNR